MKVKIRKVGNRYGIVLPRRVIERLPTAEGDVLNLTETATGIKLITFDRNFSEQVEAFRRTESRHRNSYQKLAK
jgi:antitoxin MazE